MITPQLPGNENQRLNALHDYNLLDSPSELEFDQITLLASQICGTPISAISLVDEKRQWFKSKQGLASSETPRDVSFCAHAINAPLEVLVVPDARKDERFFNNPLVTGDPEIVFYAGVPLVDENGYALGALCAIDNQPRELSTEQIQALRILSQQVINLFRARKRNFELSRSQSLLLECISLFSPYFLLIDAGGEIREVGKNFMKQIKDLKIGGKFSDWFEWTTPFSAEKLLDSTDPHNKLLFFNSKNGLQKYKCSVKRNDSKSYFILSNPVINTQYPLVNYSVNVSDFPRHDYIAEYLFLQQAATKGLEDAGKLNMLLKERNSQLEVSKNALMNANSVLEERINKRTKEIKNLALFPEQNPNPVLEINFLEQAVTYINPAARKKITDHENKSFSQILNLLDIDKETIAQRNTEKHEIFIDGCIYERNMFFLEENHAFRIYLHDITEIRRQEKKEKEENEKFIRQQNALLDMRSLPQTFSLQDKLKFIGKKTSEMLNCTRCSIWFYNPEKSAITTHFIYLKEEDRFADGTTIPYDFAPTYFHSLNKKEVIDAIDAETHPATFEFAEPYLRPLKIKSMLDIPLIQTAESIGVICNEYTNQKSAFPDDEISFARSVADVIVLAYETEMLKISREELSEKNQSLKDTMDRLVDMQNDVIQQEKLATLGMLIAGIAHEINTPLGAIKASSENLQDSISLNLMEKMNALPRQDIADGIRLFELSRKEKSQFTTREERQHIKNIDEFLGKKYPDIEQRNIFARKMVELGFINPGDELDVFIRNENRLVVFSFAEIMHKIMKSIGTISLAVDKASKVLKALNTFSHGNIEKEISTFNLYESLDSVITLLWNKIKYSATISNAVSREVFVLANPEELSQVWTNIINNALQASNNTCHIWIDYTLENGQHLISISNDGPAIPEHHLPKIFDAFFSTKKRGEGTGLGLNIVKKIVEKNNGSIYCNSNTERTTFVITLPQTTTL